MGVDEEEYEPCYGCDKPVPHSAEGNYLTLPREPFADESERTMLCDDCIRQDEEREEEARKDYGPPW